jgi:diguanylate cyclase (GGDEF)-like protein/PAS domain S-box-containing protein
MPVNPLALFLVLPTLLMGSLTVYAWSRRSTPGAYLFFWFLLAVTIYTFGYMLELASSTLPQIFFWVNVEYLGIAAIPPLWLALVITYAGKEKWLNFRHVAVLFIIPLITLALNWTSWWQPYYYSKLWLVGGAYPLLGFTRGPWYWVQQAYTFTAIFGGTLYLMLRWRHASAVYRNQARAMMVGALGPLVAWIIYLSMPGSGLRIDWTPFAFTFAGAVAAWGMFRYRLLELTPIASDTLLEELEDGIITLDPQQVIVDINPAARRIFRLEEKDPIGQPLEAVTAGMPGVAELCRAASRMQIEVRSGSTWLELTSTLLYDGRRRLLGRLLLARDITRMKTSEEELRQSMLRLEKLNELSRTLGSSLELERILQSAVEQAGGLMEAESCQFYQLSGQKLTFAYGHPAGASHLLAGTQPREWQARVRQALETKQTQLAAAGQQVAFVPLVQSEKKLGVLTFSLPPGRSFSQDELLLAESVGRQVAVALENARLFREVQLLAQTDSLTGVDSRSHLFTLAEHEFNYARRYNTEVALIMLDIDHFKEVNDTFGHSWGDVVLKQIAGVLRKTLRKVDRVGRYGGEEFIILLPATGLEETCPVAERIRQQIEALRIETEQGDIQVTVSLGAVEVDLKKDKDVEDLVRRADTALYAAKKAGRNRVVCMQ